MKCEIEFMPVGSASKPGDAIIIRYGTPETYELMVIDGGTLESGKQMVEHLRNTFGRNVIISHILLTHSDADHASGLRTILTEIPVKNLWLHIPWLHAEATLKYFENKKWTVENLCNVIKREYDLIDEIVNIALKLKIPIYEPFAGYQVGPFRILSPSKPFYELLIPQFDRTPVADQAEIEAAGFWIGKQQPQTFMAKLLDKGVAKLQKWVKETWENERLKDGGITSASNESCVVLYGEFDAGFRALLTGDAGIWALTLAAYHAEQSLLLLKNFSFVQIPHHGIRRNVGPTILNRLIGEIQPLGNVTRFTAFVSAPKDDDTHPRKMVLNAFLRRGANVVATQGDKIIHYGGFPTRVGYRNADLIPFSNQVEDYD